jgi:hypothetical protein
MVDNHEDDLAATQTEGFKVGEKKTIDEYNQLGEWSPLIARISIDYATSMLCPESSPTNTPFFPRQ